MSLSSGSSGSAGKHETPLVVGLGASAGGLKALERFLANTVPDQSMAFVVVTHTSAARPSLLPEILARQCLLPVEEVTSRRPIRADRVYVAPSGASLEVSEWHLAPRVSTTPSGDLPIDYFFRSLAQEVGDRAVGIVLSGTGSDGTLGLKEIRGAGGMVMAQVEATAGHGGMPHSAIAALELDHVLAPEDMPQVLRAYADRAVRRLPPDPNEPSAAVTAEIFDILCARTGHDFTQYKLSSVKRRIVRRLNLHQLETGSDYLKLVKSRPTELDHLLKELLINVTSFFRDPEAFEVLQKHVLPGIIAERDPNDIIRLWVPGCASGEEAYSLAIAVRECLDAANACHALQVFATDLDADAIEQGRAGLFPDSIAIDVTAQRLQRFFVREDNCYRIKKEIRDCVIFARQNVISDPPFTNLDLLSCRNLLIYLDAALQKRLMPLFHYTLRPKGILFLGSSEGVGHATSLFDWVDKRWKIFRRRESIRASSAAGVFSHRLSSDMQTREVVPAFESRRTSDVGISALAEKALLQHLLPPTVLIHERGEIVHIHGRTGQFLEPAPGPQAQASIFNMIRPGLHLELAVAIRQAKASEGNEIVYQGAQARSAEGPITVNLRVRQLLKPEPLKGLLMVTFEQVTPDVSTLRPQVSDASEVDHSGTAMRDWVQHLEREMRSVREVHQTTVEELETSNEELRSTNEELQSTNEELQSTNEELETSKEEMQSLTEELYTVNAELQSKVEDLSRSNDDMKNLLNGTDIATLFLDSQLQIKRFTQETSQIIRVIASDVGRPVSDLVSKLHYDALVKDAQEVLQTLVPREAEVQSTDGRWYLMRILPYRTADNVIDGLVLTFVDITTVKALQQRTERVITALSGAAITVFTQDSQLRYQWVSAALFEHPPEKVLAKTDYDLLAKADADQLHSLKQHVLASGKSERKLLRLMVGARPSQYRIYLEPLRGEAGVTGLVGVLGNVEV